MVPSIGRILTALVLPFVLEHGPLSDGINSAQKRGIRVFPDEAGSIQVDDDKAQDLQLGCCGESESGAVFMVQAPHATAVLARTWDMKFFAV